MSKKIDEKLVEEICREHKKFCDSRKVMGKGCYGQTVENMPHKCKGCPYDSEWSCLVKFALSWKPRKAKKRTSPRFSAFMAMSAGDRNFLTYTYGKSHGEPIESKSMRELARSIAYLYHRHPIDLLVSEDGKAFRPAPEEMQKTFHEVMDEEFRLDELRG